MRFTPKQTPEGINTSSEHPLKELLLLLSAAIVIITFVVYLVIISTDYLVKYIPVSYEAELFNFSNSASDSESENADLKVVEQYLKDIVANLQNNYDGEPQQFTIDVVKSEIPNAFAFPGGRIGVTTGLLNIIETENGLAMVLGHEMGHHYARDPIKALGRGVVLGVLVAAIMGSGTDSWVQSLVTDITGLGMTSFSRDQERQADLIGKNLLLKYYGHAGGASEFFKKIQGINKDKFNTVNFFDTHPNTEERIQILTANVHGTEALVVIPESVKKAISAYSGLD